MHRHRMLLLASLATGLATSAGTAQSSATVPVEVAQALIVPLISDEGPQPEILVGRIAPAVDSVLTLPEGSRILGSLLIDHYSRSVVEVPAPASQAVAGLEAQLRAAGWTHPPRREQPGFQSARPGGDEPFCRHGRSIVIGSGPATQGRALLAIYEATHPTPSICNGPARPQTDPDTPIPSLQPAPEWDVSNLGTGSGGGRAEARAEIRTTAAPAEILRHYAAQLAARGWRARDAAAAESVAAQAWEATDEDGARWHAVLVITALGGERRGALLQATRLEE